MHYEAMLTTASVGENFCQLVSLNEFFLPSGNVGGTTGIQILTIIVKKVL